MQGAPDWAARLLDEVSRIYLLADSYQRIDTLPPELQEEIRTAIGWSHKREELLALPAVRDQWHVTGQIVEGDDTLRTRRVWLLGEKSGNAALILDFAAGRASFEELYMTGQRYDAEIIYYPGSFPMRALVKEIFTITTPDNALDNTANQLPGYANVAAMLNDYATALGGNPWIERIPFVLRDAIVAPHSEGWALYDADAHMLKVKASGRGFDQLWSFLAQSGGHPTTVVGEWDGYEVNLLGVAAN
jgi:hypothetical protein